MEKAKEKAKVEVVINVESGKIDCTIYAPDEMIQEFIEQLKDAEQRGEIIIEKIEIS